MLSCARGGLIRKPLFTLNDRRINIPESCEAYERKRQEVVVFVSDAVVHFPRVKYGTQKQAASAAAGRRFLSVKTWEMNDPRLPCCVPVFHVTNSTSMELVFNVKRLGRVYFVLRQAIV